jgi:hypothetical protein
MGDLIRGSCNPVFCSPSGPHLPFGTWYLAIFDTVRLVTIFAALGMMMALGIAWARSAPHGGQRDRYMALAVFAVVVIGTEVENLGNIASYRLVLSTIGVVLAYRGLWRFRHEQPSIPEGLSDG